MNLLVFIVIQITFLSVLLLIIKDVFNIKVDGCVGNIELTSVVTVVVLGFTALSAMLWGTL